MQISELRKFCQKYGFSLLAGDYKCLCCYNSSTMRIKNSNDFCSLKCYNIFMKDIV